MICVINEPETNGEDHHFFKFYDVVAVEDPGEETGCKNRKPCYGIEGNGSERKPYGKSDEKELERDGDFKFKENKVAEDAYDCCNNAAHSSEKIMGNAHKGELDALDNKNFVFAFDKSGKDHYGAGNY